MFTPPPVVVPEVFCSVPDAFRKTDSADWLRVQKHGAIAHSFLEGPAFDREGNLYVTDIPFGRIFRISEQGQFSLVLEYDGEPNGLKFGPDGFAYIADHKHGILRLDVTSGAYEVYLDRPRLERFIGVNDLFFTANGDLYFTDQGQSGLQSPNGSVYRYSRQQRLERVLTGIPSPNGLVVAPDGRSLLVAVTRANAVWRAPLLDDGTVSKVGVFLNLSGGFGPDGMALDAEGNLAVAHPGLGCVWLFNPDGEPLLRIQSRSGKVLTNLAYGGPHGQWLYMTEADTGHILRVSMPHPGMALHQSPF